jgi:hypothetical protein
MNLTLSKERNREIKTFMCERVNEQCLSDMQSYQFITNTILGILTEKCIGHCTFDERNEVFSI